MISYDFEYCRPTSIEKAVHCYQAFNKQQKKPVYYSGGTEITTLGRLNKIRAGAVIDLKGISECHVLQFQDNQLVMGSAISFSKLKEANLFPLLSQTISEVADHTARSSITLGGNVCGNIFYREAVLPLLLTDSQVKIAGTAGTKQISIHEVFNKQVQLQEGEFLVQFLTDQSYLQLPFMSMKKRKHGAIGYPLVTVAAILKKSEIRVAFSGLADFPFRDQKIENILNQKKLSAEDRIEQVLKNVPVNVLDDVEGSAEYRLFVLKNTLYDVLVALEGVENV